MTKAATQALSALQLLRDFDIMTKGMIMSDSSAALGIVQREGLGGRTRHIQVQYLWMQERVAREELAVKKIDTKRNPADLMTKHLGQEDRDKMLNIMKMITIDEKDPSARSIHLVTQKARDYWAKIRNPGSQEKSKPCRSSERVENMLIELDEGEFDQILTENFTNCSWIRRHDKLRQTLFTPMKVAKGPVDSSDVDGLRISLMRRSDKFLMKTDEWKEAEDPHEKQEAFTGWTMFAKRLYLPSGLQEGPAAVGG